MNEPPAVAPVRIAIVVDVPREHAFTVFTERFDAWWPRGHHIGAAAMAAAVIEPREGGRWYERGIDGSEAVWGSVLAWEPPARLVLAWQINGQWEYDDALVTELEVTFTAEGEGRTRVELEHRYLKRFGADADEMRGQFSGEGGWTGLLQLFAGEAEDRRDLGGY